MKSLTHKRTLFSLLAIVSSLTFSACSVKFNSTQVINNLTARDAIELSEAAAPEGVPGYYSLLIKAHGKQRDTLYLNTQLDYRDRRNVSLVFSKHIQQAFLKETGQPIEHALLNQSVLINGHAQREKIWFYKAGMRSEKYYFQTHIRINDLSQIISY